MLCMIQQVVDALSMPDCVCNTLKQVLHELEALLQNTKHTLNILFNGFQLCTEFHDWRTRYCILVWVSKDWPTMVPAIANEIDTPMNFKDTIHTSRTPRLGVQLTYPFQQVHHSAVGSHYMFVVSGSRMPRRNRLDKLPTIADNFIRNGTKPLLVTKHDFLHGWALIPHKMDAVHASNTAGESPGCVLSHHISVLVVVSWHVYILDLDGVHIGNPLQRNGNEPLH